MGKNSLANLNFEEDSAPARLAPQSAIGLLSVEREARSIEMQMVAAKRFPRDLNEVESGITQICESARFAAQSKYIFQRGGQDITGPSVRLVEAVAQIYGNIEHSTNEIMRHDGFSECESYAWDMQNNVRVTRKFTVPHTRDTKQGKKRVTDDRDIRELVLNFGARNERACMERVIPKFLIDMALEMCDKTLASATNGNKFEAAVANALKHFKDELNIEKHDVEIIVGEIVERWTKTHYNRAVGFFNSLLDNQTTVHSLLTAAPRVTAKQIEELAGLGVPNASDVYAADYEAKKAEYEVKKTVEGKEETTVAEPTVMADKDGVVVEEKQFSEDDFINGLNQ